MTTGEAKIVEVIESALAQVEPYEGEDWVLATKLVAEGYGCTSATIRGHKKDHGDELLEGSHWLKTPQGHTLWTRRGVIRLGMFVKTEQGRLFRDYAERVVVSDSVGRTNAAICDTVGKRNAEAQESFPATVSEANANADNALEATAEQVAEVVVEQLSAEELFKDRVNHHVRAKLDAKLPEMDAESLGKQLAAQWGLEQVAGLAATIAARTGAKCNS